VTDVNRTVVTPGGAFMSVLLFSCFAVLVIACAIPHRAIVQGTPRATM
jgi:hypothetical protein